MESGSLSEDEKALGDLTRDRIRKNLSYLVCNLNTSPCFDHLEATDHMTAETRSRLTATKDPSETIRGLINYVKTGSQGCFNEFINALRDSNQHAVADRLTSTDTSAVSGRVQEIWLTELRRHHHLIIDNLRFEDNFLIRLESRSVITSVQIEELMTIPSRRDKAKQLLRVLMKGETPERTRGFVSALYETDQPHLALMIETGDASQIIKSDIKKIATQHKLKVMSEIREEMNRTSLPSLLARLEDGRVITASQVAIVQSKDGPENQVHELIDIIVCRPWSAVQHGFITNPETLNVAFRMLSLQGDTEQHMTTKYLSGLRMAHKTTQLKLNAKLNRRFGIDCSTKPFYIRLSMGSCRRTSLQEMEEYIRRTAQNVKTMGDIDIHNIFDKVGDNAEAPTRVLLLGGAGTGKSTVTQQLAHGWASGQIMRDTIAAFHFECRSFTADIGKEKECSFADLLFKMHGPGHLTDDEIQDHFKFLVEHQSKIQITFDGLDELSRWGDVNPQSQSKITDPFTTKAQIQCLIHNVIHKNLLPDAKIFATSRPISTVNESDFSRCVVALGFSEESIRQCMQALCGDKQDLCDDIMNYLQAHPELYSQCVVPLNCVYLGSFLRHDLSKEHASKKPFLIDSITRLNIRVVLENIWKRPTQKAKSFFHLSEEQRQSLANLAHLAARGMLENENTTKIVFDDDDLEELDMKPDDEYFGLLEVNRDVSLCFYTDRPEAHTASFLHLSVQEFLAALHISLTWDPANLESLFCQKTRRLDMVRIFMSGLLGDPEGLKFLQAADKDVSIDLIGERAQALFENICSSREDRDIRNLKFVRLQVLRCVAEGKMASMVPELEHYILEDQDGFMSLDLTDFPGGLLPHQMASVGYWLHASLTATNLVLKNCEVSGAGIAALLDTARLAEERLTGLRKIILADNPLGDKTMEILAQFLVRNPNLKILQLECCNIGPVGIHTLDIGTPGLTSLNELWLYDNPLGDAGMKYLTPVVSRNIALQKLFLWEAGIGDEGVGHLAKALDNHAKIKEIYLQRNQIGVEGAMYLAKILRLNSSMHTLILNFNQMGDLGAGHIAEALREHPGLSEIQLSNNLIGDIGAKHLADALRVNPVITSLSICRSLLSDEMHRGLKAEFDGRIHV